MSVYFNKLYFTSSKCCKDKSAGDNVAAKRLKLITSASN